MSDNIDNTDKYKTIVAGLLLFVIAFLILWRASAGVNLGLDSTAEHQNLNVSSSTVKPQQQLSFASTCQCPASPNQVVVGAIDKASVIGQGNHESNSTYSFADCQSNAAEMVNLLQDEHLFKYSQAITRNGIGGYPPKHLYFTWDQEARICKFYTSCGGMTQCNKKNIVTGMVMPTSVVQEPPIEH